MKLHFYHCNICGKIIAVFDDSGIPTDCCDETMEELIPNTTDGAFEKHVPVFSNAGDTVSIRIGSDPHPMTDDHSINWIGLRTLYGFQFRELKPGDKPEAWFLLSPGDKVEESYAYCNIHGLWSKANEPGT